MLADELDRARTKCRSGRHECLGGDREATGRHARLQLSLRRHRLKRQLREETDKTAQSATMHLGTPRLHAAHDQRTYSIVHPLVVPQELRYIFRFGRYVPAPIPALIAALLLPAFARTAITKRV